jgi:hypothetical protein
MPLKFVIDRLEDVDEGLRPHYVQDNGKFRLDAQDPRVPEFRDNNIAKNKELEALRAKYEGVDPDAAKADRLKLAELEKAAPRVAELEAQLAAEKSRSADARVRDAFRVKVTAVGAEPKGVDMLANMAAPLFTIEGDLLKARPDTFSPTRPGEPLTANEWVANAVAEYPFLFAASTGGGAAPSKYVASRGNELRDPTPQQLGQHAGDIAAGRMRVTYSK